MRAHALILSILLTLVACGDVSRKRSSLKALPHFSSGMDHAEAFIHNLPATAASDPVSEDVQRYLQEVGSRGFNYETKFGQGLWSFPVDSRRSEILLNQRWLQHFQEQQKQARKEDARRIANMVDYLQRQIDFQHIAYELRNRNLVEDFLSPYYEISSIPQNPSAELLQQILNNLQAQGGYYHAYADELVKQLSAGEKLYSTRWLDATEAFRPGVLEEYFMALENNRPELRLLVSEVLSQLPGFHERLDKVRTAITFNPADILGLPSDCLVQQGISSDPRYYQASLRKNGIEVTPMELIAMGEKGLKDAKFSMSLVKTAMSTLGITTQKIKETYRGEDDYLSSVMKMTEKIAKDLKQHSLISVPSDKIHYFYNKNDELGYGSLAAIFPSVQGEFKGFPTIIIPDYQLSVKGQSDFVYKGTAHAIMAHEGRPGHEMHFTLLSNLTDIIKKKVLINTAFVEGWGLYSEHIAFGLLGNSDQDLIYKYYHGQALALRSARAILDAKLALGLITREEAIAFLQREVGNDRGYATAEVDRYLSDPGRDGAYFYGHMKLLQERENLRQRVGRKFTELCFNDAIMSIGSSYFANLNQELNKFHCR